MLRSRFRTLFLEINALYAYFALPIVSLSQGAVIRIRIHRFMIRSCCLVIVFLWVGLSGWSVGYAQQNRLLPVEDWTYEFIKRLQRRGHLLQLDPTSFPYRRGAVWEALEQIDRESLSRVESQWVTLLDRELRPVTREDGEIAIGVEWEGGARLINGDRLDPVRPLGDTLNVFPNLSMPFYMEAGAFIANAAPRFDTYYDQDPDGLDTALRLMTRSEDTYLGVHSRYFSGYLGRFSNLWGVPGESAAFVSNNPRSQDQVNLRLGGQRLSIQGILSELDSITEDNRYTGRVADDTVQVDNKRRYLAAHRWNWRPTRFFTISLIQSIIYSGKNSGISLKYLNPLHNVVFSIDNIPKNDENNGLFGGLIWGQYRKLTVHGQFMVDDFDALGIGDEPMSLTLVGSLHYAAPTMDFGGSLILVASRTYNAQQFEGQYIYLLRGLATQFNDYIHTSFYADLYLDHLTPGLRVTPRLHLLAQGERDIREPFPQRGSGVAFVLDGTPERTVRPSVELYYQPVPWGWLRLDAGVNFVSNQNHIEGDSESRFVGLLEFGFRFSLDGAYRLSLPWN